MEVKNKTMLVEEFSTPSSQVVRANVAVPEVAEIFEKNNFRHMPVVDEQGHPVGILSDRDIKVIANFELLKSLKVEDLMSPEPYITASTTPLEEVALTMSKNKIGSAVITYSDDDSIGIFTSTDALNALIEILRGEYDS